jgi:hypothetical protein
MDAMQYKKMHTDGNFQKEKIVEELILNLKKLPDPLPAFNPKSDYNDLVVRDVLEAAYDIAIAEECISEVDKNQIGLLLKTHIKQIETFIFHYVSNFDIDHGPYMLILRSGLQIMLDNYKDFPTGSGDETLGVVFGDSNVPRWIKFLDDNLRRWKDNIHIVGYDNVVHEDEDLTIPPELPKSHTWWIYTSGTGDAVVRL